MDANQTPKPCELCGCKPAIKSSHITPSFVVRWMKETGSSYLRLLQEPNVRKQDGPKTDMLCPDCEQRLSLLEKDFSEKIFRPVVTDHTGPLSYGPSEFAFAVSVLWRCLVHHRRLGYHKDLGSRVPHRAALAEAEHEWGQLLLEGTRLSKFGDIHMFLTDIGTADGRQPVVGFNRYMARAIDLDIGWSEDHCFVYHKFSRFIFVGAVLPLPKDALVHTRLAPDGGVLDTPQSIGDPDIGSFIVDRARRITQRMCKVSPRQKQRIRDHFHENAEQIVNSDQGRAMAADFKANVEGTVSKQLGRNSLCPCGSGKKVKQCHSHLATHLWSTG